MNAIRKRPIAAVVLLSVAGFVLFQLKVSFTRSADPPKRQLWPGQGNLDRKLYDRFFANGDHAGKTFVEMGAVDGIGYSNTFALETYFGWTGVLIEANPDSCAKLFRNRPQSLKLCSAICQEDSAVMFEFTSDPFIGAALDKMTPEWRYTWHTHRNESWHDPKDVIQMSVPCSRLGRLLRMVGVSKIDLFSLDVEGSELEVLESMDWTIPVRIWCIEVQSHLASKISAIMRGNGYKLIPSDTHTNGIGNTFWEHDDFDALVRRYPRWQQFVPAFPTTANAATMEGSER